MVAMIKNLREIVGFWCDMAVLYSFDAECFA